MAKISIVGLLLANNTIFDDMVLPAGVDHDLVVSEICNECYDLEILFPDPEYMKHEINHWSRRRLYAWDELWKTTKYIYNPIWNKDGVIIEEEDGNNSANSKTNSTSGVRGYNDSGIVTNENTNADTDAEANHHIARKRVEQGNIGVTTTQQMIKEQREISDFDIYEIIVKDFKKHFCLLVY